MPIYVKIWTQYAQIWINMHKYAQISCALKYAQTYIKYAYVCSGMAREKVCKNVQIYMQIYVKIWTQYAKICDKNMEKYAAKYA